MSDEDEQSKNEYLHLPDDREEAFAVLHRRKYNECEESWSENRGGDASFSERRYVDTLVAFDEVHDLGILTIYRNPPISKKEFSDFFQDFRRHAEITSQKILMEAARRVKVGAQQIVVLDASARPHGASNRLRIDASFHLPGGPIWNGHPSIFRRAARGKSKRDRCRPAGACRDRRGGVLNPG